MSSRDSENYIKKMFREYYLKWDGRPPKEYERREYGFVPSRKGDVLRHVSFNDWREMKEFLAKNAPLHVYYSSAYYLQPSAQDMESKEWLGADLVFDIDVDHIYTPCKERHDKWLCLDCNFNGKGMAPEACPKCSSKRIDGKAWFCEECLNVAREETEKLVEDFLMSDFGFSEEEVEIVFSGRRGFHIHVENDVVKQLDQKARREIVDYVKGMGLILEGGRKKAHAPPLNASGWHGRIARGVYELLVGCDKEGAGIEEGTTKTICEKLQESKGYWLVEGDVCRAWLSLAKKAVASKRCNIDERVTIDVKRLIRLPETLHGGTGLIALRIDIDGLSGFDPYKHAVAFNSGEIKVKVAEAPKITFMGQEWGPYLNQVVEVPTGLAVYLISSGNAEVSP
ncbi:MAG: DNA primase small subunit PriS [Candidatus Nezhaarchaeota archaeon]|nr:DNA primase small subunit PriS [Candidatus Nezhaarchaeota archaeon]